MNADESLNEPTLIEIQESIIQMCGLLMNPSPALRSMISQHKLQLAISINAYCAHPDCSHDLSLVLKQYCMWRQYAEIIDTLSVDV